jgi:CheY-like chemotaxis protein
MPKTKILIVEGQPEVRALCAKALSLHDFDYITETKGLDGLNTYRERHAEIGLVLSDVTMPVMGGIELARNLFEIDSHAKDPDVGLFSR